METICEDKDYCSALQTDFYELTMAQGYRKRKMNSRAVFEMFFRRAPFEGGFAVFAGLQPLLDKLQKLGFSRDDIDYLAGLRLFEDDFLKYLEGFRFTGDLYAVKEGSVVFPGEPLIRIDGNMIECQIIESLLLNIVNFQSLIATKTARVYYASEKGNIMEFGLRRAQGPDGALSASRAAFIGGAAGTSNVLAGKIYGIKVMGTMAHSWIMAFQSEEEAFRAYAELYPNHPVFLIDTYDTLKKGIVSAIKVGKEVQARGGTFGVRLDSGDMTYLSNAVRKMLDEAGCESATIAVSNDLDEVIIENLMEQGAAVNSWGVGTRMVTGWTESAFTGVYKLAARESGGKFIPAIKFSNNPEKTTLPGVKQVWRLKDKYGMLVADVLGLDSAYGEDDEVFSAGKRYRFWHPSTDYRHFSWSLESGPVPLLEKQLEGGRQITPERALPEIQSYCKLNLESLDNAYKRLLNPHIYKVCVTEKLRVLKLELIKNHLGEL